MREITSTECSFIAGGAGTCTCESMPLSSEAAALYSLLRFAEGAVGFVLFGAAGAVIGHAIAGVPGAVLGIVFGAPVGIFAFPLGIHLTFQTLESWL